MFHVLNQALFVSVFPSLDLTNTTGGIRNMSIRLFRLPALQFFTQQFVPDIFEFLYKFVLI